MEHIGVIREQAGKIVASGVLGRSKSYTRLLEFLVERSAEGRTPKEIEIATEVFGKGADFDPSQDSMVRVYAHNLRQKIRQFYEGEGRHEPHRITISKGEYRVVLQEPKSEAAGAPDTAPRPVLRPVTAAVAGLALLVVGLLIGVGLGRGGSEPSVLTPQQAVAASPIWNQLLDDDIPTLLVVGDYYIFGELDEQGNVARLVREFQINSSRDLENMIMFDPERAEHYIDLDLTYLARSTAFAMRDVLRVLYTSNKTVRVASMSELNVADLKASHIVYVGYISALDKLLDFVFASSSLEVGVTFDELVDKETGHTYMSEAGLPADSRNYRDYGLFSSFPGPNGNQFVIVAGTRDAGLMHSAQALTDPAHVRAAVHALTADVASPPRAFELLYEVTGFDRTNLDAMLVHAARLDYRNIWGGELLLED